MKRDGGFTVAEFAIASAVLLLVGAISGSVLFSMQRTVNGQQTRSRINTEARTAAQRLDRQIRSGNVLNDPSTETPPNYRLTIYTQADADDVTNPARCVQWRVETGTLQRRSWPPTFGSAPDPATVSPWRVEAESIVNAAATPAVPPFETVISQAGRVRTVNITVLANDDVANHPERTARIEFAATGRNTVFNYPTNACTPTPA